LNQTVFIANFDELVLVNVITPLSILEECEYLLEGLWENDYSYTSYFASTNFSKFRKHLRILLNKVVNPASIGLEVGYLCFYS